MKAIVKRANLILFTALLCLHTVMPVWAQRRPSLSKSAKKDFYTLLADADLSFTCPAGFKEIPAINNEYFSFDYAMQIPGRGFEMWMQIKSQKQNWVAYEKAKNDKRTEVANPDSMYLDLGHANAIALTGDKNLAPRNIPPEALSRYNADEGKSYLLDLPDLSATKHYKYALLISLQKNHTGTLVAIYFTNQKDPDFYRNVNRTAHNLKFKPQTAG